MQGFIQKEFDSDVIQKESDSDVILCFQLAPLSSIWFSHLVLVNQIPEKQTKTVNTKTKTLQCLQCSEEVFKREDKTNTKKQGKMNGFKMKSFKMNGFKKSKAAFFQ